MPVPVRVCGCVLICSCLLVGRTYPTHNMSSERCDDHCFKDKKLQNQNVCRSTCNNPNATIYIITGAAGSAEMHSPFDLATPTYTAYRSNTFGYSRFLVHNSTHAQWQQVQTDPNVFTGATTGNSSERSCVHALDQHTRPTVCALRFLEMPTFSVMHTHKQPAVC